MVNIVRLSLCGLLCPLLVSHLLIAQYVEEEAGYLRRPSPTPHGTVFTDSRAERIYVDAGKEVRTLVESPGCGNGFTLAPSKTLLGFKQIAATGKQTPAILDLETGTIHPLHSPSDRVGQVSFADDGTFAFAVGEDLVIVSAGVVEQIPLGYYANTAPISPDGSAVAFNDASDQLWVLDIPSRRRTCITDGAKGYHTPQWSHDGTRILFSSLDGEGFIVDKNGGGRLALGPALSPAWSGDDAFILFHRNEVDGFRFIDSDLFIASSHDGSSARLTATPDQAEMDPVLSFDGSAVVYLDYRTSAIVQCSIVPSTSGQIVLSGAPEIQTSFRPVPSQTSDLAGVLQKRAGTMQLDIPYVHQTYDTPDWHNGNSACAPTAAIMVLAYYNILPPWQTSCSTPYFHYNSWGNYVAGKYYFRGVYYANFQANDPNGNPAWGGFGYMWSTGSPHTRMADYYRNHGMSAVQSEGTPHSTVKAEVLAGVPYTLCVMLTTAGHLVIPHGLGAEEHTFVFNDPYGDKNRGYKNYYGKNVQYDWPGYNNGFQNLTGVAWGIGTSYTPPAVCDTIVEDLQFGNGFYLHAQAPATMEKWRSRTLGYSGHSWILQSTLTDSAYATWTLATLTAGRYQVDAYVPQTSTAMAYYKVTHAAGTTTVSVDQKSSVNSWVSLGAYDFNGAGSVRLGSGSDASGLVLGFDAIRWTAAAVTGIAETSELPLELALGQNYPNPFNPSTKIEIRNPKPQHLRMVIVDLLGREIAVLRDGIQPAGRHVVTWDATGLPSGMYLCRFQAGEQVFTRRMVLVR